MHCVSYWIPHILTFPDTFIDRCDMHMITHVEIIIAEKISTAVPADGIIVVTFPQDLVSMIAGKVVKMAEMMAGLIWI